MPGFNGTGPLGQGSMTGRGLGPCSGGQAYGRGIGRGLGRGFGRGLGFGRGFGVQYRQPTKTEETANTKAYISDLETELQNTQRYLKDLQGKK